MKYVGISIWCLLLLAVSAFCGFGFLATFEPLENPAEGIVFRIGYGVIGSAAILGIVLLIVRACRLQNTPDSAAESATGGRGPEGASTILVLGILGLVVCQILGVVAWVQGNTYMQRCKEMGVEPEDTAVAGRICGIVASVLMIVSLAMVVVYLAGLSGNL
ncbi:MAG: hypothetical protein VB861_18285 [Planctomycetaceae bacterium]